MIVGVYASQYIGDHHYPKPTLVGGLVAIFEIFPEILCEFHHPNWRSPSFFRGVAQPPTRLLLIATNV